MHERPAVTDAAHAYLAAGLCVLPARRAQKRPAVGAWKPYQQRRPTPAELAGWLAQGPDGLCIVCGAVSGHVETIDFDAGGEQFGAWADRIPAALRDRLVIEATPSGGWHVVYRCPAGVSGNLKLAQRRRENGTVVTLIETRGEGGLFLCAPTAGYELMQGELDELPVLTAEERDMLLSAAWELNAYVPPVVNGPRRSAAVGQRGALSANRGAGCAENAQGGDCPSDSVAMGQRAPSSAAHGDHAADSSHIGGCLSNSAALGQRVPPSAAQDGCAAQNAHTGSCRSHNGDVGQRAASSVAHGRGEPESAAVCDSPSHNAAVRQRAPSSATHRSCETESAGVGGDLPHGAPLGQRSASSAPVGDCAADNAHIGACPSNSGAVRPTAPSSAPPGHGGADSGQRPGDDFNIRGDVRAVLQQYGWSLARPGENEYWRRPGKSNGWSATLKDRVFYVFSANAAPFEPNRAYAPFAVYALLAHGGDFERAASALRLQGFGSDRLAAVAGVDLSGFAADAAPAEPAPPAAADPGPMPAEMLRIPGFISEVMDHCLATAPYPNPTMAFAGALSLQALLAGRKVRDPGDNRTNIYLLGLAHSAAGKDHPRKINTQVLHQVGLAECLGERFASGEGIQDALFQTPSMLFQTDEIDGMLQSINRAKDARHEAIMGTLLTMYSKANSVFPMRRRAGKESPGVIDQPCLSIFGTAIPNHYYEALSERMLTNGFFARMIILEAGQRGSGQEPCIRDLPPRVLATARWWADYQPGQRRDNLIDLHPVPAVVPHTEQARRLLVENRQQAEAEYAAAESKSDPVGTTVWGRVSEQTRKLALLYAVSEDHLQPRIHRAAVQWASAFVIHQTRRMLFMASQHVAEGEFDALVKRTVEILRQWRDKNGPEALMPAWELRRRLKQRPGDFKDVVLELTERRIAMLDTEKASTKPKSGYRLL